MKENRFPNHVRYSFCASTKYFLFRQLRPSSEGFHLPGAKLPEVVKLPPDQKYNPSSPETSLSSGWVNALFDMSEPEEVPHSRWSDQYFVKSSCQETTAFEDKDMAIAKTKFLIFLI